MVFRTAALGFIALLAGVLSPGAIAQPPAQRLEVPVFSDGVELPLALAGGLNNPQVSQPDFNADGIPDLYLFDRTGAVHLAFVQRGSPGDPQWEWAPGYTRYFPPVDNWVLLRDFNGDGAADLFCESDTQISGIAVYRGFYQADTLRFERINLPGPFPQNVLTYIGSSGNRVNLAVTRIDYPAVDDIDCDGDLDILTFNLVGGYVEFFRNQSQELGFGRDSLNFVLDENCWGGFFESGLSSKIDLAPAPGICVQPFGGEEPLNPRHAGSTLLTLDTDNDGDKELILGDLSFPNLVFLHNGGDCDEAWMDQQDTLFPALSAPVDIPYFPASFYHDIDFDGQADLLAAPNSAVGAEDREVLWWYRNAGTTTNPEFSLQSRTFLVEDMLDFGTGAFPAFADVNADGLVDMVVGTITNYTRDGERNPRLVLLENTGTSSAPSFALADPDFLSMSQFGNASDAFAPAFGDLDGDGDLDLLVGESNGQLFFARNTAGPGMPVSFEPFQYGYAGIDVGIGSIPAIADLNEDGLPDLIVGEQAGNLNYFPNQGSSTDPFFISDPDQAPNTFFLGQVDTRIPNDVTGFGYSAPAFVRLANDSLALVTGSALGPVRLYTHIEGNLDGPFRLQEDPFGLIREGYRTRPALADLDGDGQLELVVGNQRGGLGLFSTELEAADPTTATAETPPPSSASLRIWPNPAGSWVKVQITSPAATTFQARLMDAQGRILGEWELQSGLNQIDLSFIPSGFYTLQAFGEHTGVVRPLIVMP